MGPSLTLTVPLNVSPSYSVSVAPGKQGAIVCGVLSASHAFSMGASIVNEFSNCIPEQPPGNGGRLLRLPGAGVRVERASAGRGQHRAAGEHLGQVLTVVGSRVRVTRSGRAFGRVLGGGPHGFRRGGLADERLLDTGGPDRRRAHVGEPDAGL